MVNCTSENRNTVNNDIKIILKDRYQASIESKGKGGEILIRSTTNTNKDNYKMTIGQIAVRSELLLKLKSLESNEIQLWLQWALSSSTGLSFGLGFLGIPGFTIDEESEKSPTIQVYKDIKSNLMDIVKSIHTDDSSSKFILSAILMKLNLFLNLKKEK